MKITKLHTGIYTIKEIKQIQQMTSFEYINEMEKVDKDTYRVVMSDTYTKTKNVNI
jgi:hypothetical protein